jgi:hypothetical protein
MPSPVVPEIVAEITLLPSTEGGREESIRQGEYRGVLGAGGEHFSFRAVVPFQDGFQPGHTARLGVQFLFPRAALEHFPVGGAFTLWEGGPIGLGKVLEVLPVTERRDVEGWH